MTALPVATRHDLRLVSPEAERAIVACAESGYFEPSFDPRDFVVDLHRDVYLVCLAAHELGLHPDLVRVCRTLNRLGYGVSLRLIADVEYLLLDVGAPIARLASVCEVVADLARRRRRLVALRSQARTVVDGAQVSAW